MDTNSAIQEEEKIGEANVMPSRSPQSPGIRHAELWPLPEMEHGQRGRSSPVGSPKGISMNRPQLRVWLVVVAVVIFSSVALASTPLSACPNCPQGLRSYSEQLAAAEVVVLAEWVAATRETEISQAITKVRISRIVKGRPKVNVGQLVTLRTFHKGKPADLYLLFGGLGEEVAGIDWRDVIPVTKSVFEYIVKAPALEVLPQKRLEYFLDYLEFPDDLVANDAFAEFANCEYRDLVALSPRFPREKLRTWIGSAGTLEVRLGLYSTMLGLCGNQGDAKLLESRMTGQGAVGAYRLGLEGLISGYLMIEGEPGLNLIETQFLRNKTTAFSDTFAAAHGLRFMWTYSERISRERLSKSMEILLERPEITDIVIADLARWKDWSVQDRLVALYGKGDYNTVAVKRAIVRYLLVCAAQSPKPDDKMKSVANSIQKAHQHLEEIKFKDPKTVADVERFYQVP